MRTDAIVRGIFLAVTLLFFLPLSIGCGSDEPEIVTGADQAAAIAEEESWGEPEDGPPEGEGEAPIRSGSQDP